MYVQVMETVANPEKVRRDSIRMIRQAWPHRHDSFRAPIVIRAIYSDGALK